MHRSRNTGCWSLAVVLAVLWLLLFADCAAAQEPPQEPVAEEEAAPTGRPSALTAAVWSRQLRPSLGGDRWLSVVAVLGAHSVGAGLAVTVAGTDRMRVSVAVGVVAPWDPDLGIDSGGAGLALGTTIGF
jgi:hypothetical protein